jgi:uncharacterized repeat protein (TIGR01451 family)
VKRSRSLSICVAVGLAVVLVLATGLTAHGAVISKKKLYSADVSPHAVTTDSVVEYTLTINNDATSQSLGSCNLTAPSGFALGAVTQHPTPGTATIDGNVLQLRNMSIPPLTSRTARFTATAPSDAGKYTWAIECRQANNYSPDQPSNRYTDSGSTLETTVSAPLPTADLAITSHTDSPDPVVGSNTVQYLVTLRNNGPANSGNITLTDTLSGGGTITSAGGTGWACSGSSTSRTCTRGPLASGANADVLQVLVTAPAADTTITNTASAQSAGTSDPDGATSAQSTTVNKDSTCASGTISCGTGWITYNQLSQVTTGSTPTAARFLVGTTTFAATASTGGQNWSMVAPAVPGNFCPVDFTDTAVTQCAWQMNLDDIPPPYITPGLVTFVGICHRSRCPEGLISGAGTLVVFIGDDGSHQILPRCSGAGDTRKCFEQARTAVINGDLRITVRNMTAGDPRVGGLCVGGGC